MISSYVRKMRSFAIAAAAIACFAASNHLVAAGTCSTPPCVTYTATGVFSTVVVSGTDTFKLAGQAFSISVNLVPESLPPSKTGTGYSKYNKLKMTGTVNSGLLPTPVTLASGAAQVELAIAKNDVFALFVPVKVVGLTFNITATINAPLGTITSTHIAPFTAPVALTSTTTSVIYSYTPKGGTLMTTTLTIASGTLSTTVKTAPTANGIAMLHATQPDGTPEPAVLRAAAIHVRQTRLDDNC